MYYTNVIENKFSTSPVACHPARTNGTSGIFALALQAGSALLMQKPIFPHPFALADERSGVDLFYHTHFSIETFRTPRAALLRVLQPKHGKSTFSLNYPPTGHAGLFSESINMEVARW